MNLSFPVPDQTPHFNPDPRVDVGISCLSESEEEIYKNKVEEEKIRTLMRTYLWEEKFFKAAKKCLRLFEKNLNTLEDSQYLKELFKKIILSNRLATPNLKEFNYSEINIIKSCCIDKFDGTHFQQYHLPIFLDHLDKKTKDIATSIKKISDNAVLLLNSRSIRNLLLSENQDIVEIIAQLFVAFIAELNNTPVDISYIEEHHLNEHGQSYHCIQ